MKIKRWLYRLLLFVLAGLALLAGLSAGVARDININYFSRLPPSPALLWEYVPYGISVLLLIEGLFLPVFRRFTMWPSKALQPTAFGSG